MYIYIYIYIYIYLYIYIYIYIYIRIFETRIFWKAKLLSIDCIEITIDKSSFVLQNILF